MEALAGSNNPTECQLGYHEDLFQVKTEQQLKKKILHLINELDFKEFSFVDMQHYSSPENRLNNFPVSLVSQYREDQLYKHDPILQHARHTTKPFFGSYIHDEISRFSLQCKIKITYEKIHHLYKGHGYYNQLYIPVNGRYLLTVAKRGCNPLEFKEEFKGYTSTLLLLAEAIFHVSTNHFPNVYPQSQRDITINAKPLQVLEMLANDDLTISQVADKLCISRITANHHLKTVRDELAVKTNNAAIKRAIQLKLIQYYADH